MLLFRKLSVVTYFTDYTQTTQDALRRYDEHEMQSTGRGRMRMSKKLQADVTSGQQRETLRQHTIPDQPWMTVGLDIFTYKRVNLILVDY